MIQTNAILLCDTYKCTHNRMYIKGLTKLWSYWVPRKSMLKSESKMVFFGLQAFIQEFLCEYFTENFFNVPKEQVLRTFRTYMNVQLGEGNYDIEPIEKLHDLGYLPLEMRALPEGTRVNMGVPCIELTNTHPDFAWLVQWVECMMQAELWKTCNHATIGNMYFRLASEWYGKTVDSDVDPRNAFADFGMRGMSCMNEACRCSAAWLLSSNKTSSVCALPYIDKYYDARCAENHIGVGAVSTEHSVIGANNAAGENEEKFLKRMLTETYPNTSFSFLGDTYDYWNFVDNILPACKAEILTHNGKLLIRPDSGDIVEITISTIQKLWDTFGGTVNSKGYKILDPHIGLIWGDNCTLNNLRQIWEKLELRKFAANNVIFGIGAFCFSAIFESAKMIVNTRDTFGIAMKATAGIIDGKFVKIFKDPKTDTDNLKKSHRGLIHVEYDPNNYEYNDGWRVIDNLTPEQITSKMKNDSIFKIVFRNGYLLNRDTFTQIRKRLVDK